MANKVSGNKITGIKAPCGKYIQEKKSCESLVEMRSSLRHFIKRTFVLCIYILNIAKGVSNIKPLFLDGCKHRFFYRGHFCKKSYWNQKKVLKNKVSKWKAGIYFHRLLISRTVFKRTFLYKKLVLFPKTFFQRTFLAVIGTSVLFCDISITAGLHQY